MEQKTAETHIPVLYGETLDALVTARDGIYLDCTLGGGGHAEGILRALSPKGRLIGVDQDGEALDRAAERLAPWGEQVSLYRNNFENLDAVLYMAGVDAVQGILMDIGVSSPQLDDPERGFSYQREAPLDMRMNREGGITARDIVNGYAEEELSRIIHEYGEERHARKIARAIAAERARKEIVTTTELVAVIRRAFPEKTLKHPAKRTFQALRIEVNRELEVLEKALRKAVAFLAPGGRLAVITFHSLEDRIVKNLYRELAVGCTCPPDLPVCVCGKKPAVKILTKKPLTPGPDELARNNRAHSAKLRVAEKL